MTLAEIRQTIWRLRNYIEQAVVIAISSQISNCCFELYHSHGGGDHSRQVINQSIVRIIRGRKCTHGWQSLTRSWSVVAGGRPRMYRLVLLSCSQPAVLELLLLLVLLLVLGMGGAMGCEERAAGGCRRKTHRMVSVQDKTTCRCEVQYWCSLYLNKREKMRERNILLKTKQTTLACRMDAGPFNCSNKYIC